MFVLTQMTTSASFNSEFNSSLNREFRLNGVHRWLAFISSIVMYITSHLSQNNHWALSLLNYSLLLIEHLRPFESQKNTIQHTTQTPIYQSDSKIVIA